MSGRVSLLKTEEPKVKESGTADNLWIEGRRSCPCVPGLAAILRGRHTGPVRQDYGISRLSISGRSEASPVCYVLITEGSLTGMAEQVYEEPAAQVWQHRYTNSLQQLQPC